MHRQSTANDSELVLEQLPNGEHAWLRPKPAVLMNRYPVVDTAGNRLQHIQLRFICGHEEEFFSLDLGRGWKPRSDRQLTDDHLRITCPIAWKLCGACSEASAP